MDKFNFQPFKIMEIGDTLNHTFNAEISIKLLAYTKKGFKVEQTEKRARGKPKIKQTFYNYQDIVGDRSFFKTQNA